MMDSHENFQRWQLLMRDVVSPQSYVDFGFYFLIASALQRRVWMGGENPNDKGHLYPNPYIVLVGEPGLGKGRVINPVNSLLKHWRYEVQSGRILEPTEELQTEYENYLFPCGPESVTFEQLVEKMSKSYRTIHWDKSINPFKAQELPRPDYLPKVYGHSSIYFALEELSSLIHKDTTKISDFFIQTYDCNDYRRETKGNGVAQLKKPCLAFLAGTTPSYMEETFKERMLTDGLSARVWFIFEFANRKTRWGIKPLDVEQLKARLLLVDWLKKLSHLYGRVELSPDADAFLAEWWTKQQPSYRPNNNLKLNAYYARKDIHVLKMCMILHFSEQFSDFVISLDTARRALAILDDAEVRMHYALNFGNRNPLHAIGRQIENYLIICKCPKSKVEILNEFGNDLRSAELDEVLQFLTYTDRVMFECNKYVATKAKNSAFQALSSVNTRPNSGSNKIIGSNLPAIPLSHNIEPEQPEMKGDWDEPD